MPGTALQVGDPKTRPLKPKLLAVLGGAVRLLLGAVTKAGNASPIVTESWACKTWVKGEESVVDDLSGSFGNAGFGKLPDKLDSGTRQKWDVGRGMCGYLEQQFEDPRGANYS